MRVVIDTNVLISAFIGRGSSHKVLEYCVHHHQVVTSRFILDELRGKLLGKFKYTPTVVAEAIGLLQARMEVVVPAPLTSPVCRDADDDNVLATALAGNCERIITGDKDLLILQRFNAIEIVNPATFAAAEGIE